MFKKLYKSVTLTAVAALLLTTFAVTPVAAAGVPGSGANSALAPLSNSVLLDSGGNHWYAFKYDFDSDDDTHPVDAQVQLTVLSGNLNFEVQTADRFGPYEDEEDDPGPVGIGSPRFKGNDDDGDGVYDDSKLIWVGSAHARDIYYVIVQGKGEYVLNISGETVSFPQWTLDNQSAFLGNGEEVAPVLNVEAEAVVPAVAVETVEIQSEEFGLTIEQSVPAGETPGYGPHSAIAPTEGTTTLQPGEWRWYQFKYGYDNSDDNESNSPEQAIASLKMQEVGSVEFEVWTPDDVKLWTDNEEFEPTGKGTPRYISDRGVDAEDKLVEDERTLTWVGSAKATQKFYIIVKNTTNHAASYTLGVSGPTVSFY